MPTDHKLRSATIARRFWLLNLLILTLTMISSALAVRFVALPFFRSYQHEAIQAQAQDSAAHLNALLMHNRSMLSMIAQDSNLVNIALGFNNNARYLPDLLDDLQMPETLLWVTFYDAFNAPLSHYNAPGHPGQLRFGAHEIRDLLKQSQEATPPDRLPVLLKASGTEAFVVMATPVLHQGYVEGVLVSGYRLATDQIFPANGIATRTYLVQPLSGILQRSTAQVRALSDFRLSVALVPDEAAVLSAGRAVMANSMTAIAVVLIGGFGLFALVGKAVIVAPHRKLEAKQAELRELAAIAERASDSISITDIEGRLVWANPSFEKLTGHLVEDVRGLKPAKFLQGPDTDPYTRGRIRNALEAREAIQVEILNYRCDDSPYWISLSISPLQTDRGTHYGFMAISNDITEARAQREAIVAAKLEIEHQALHDPLTGLPNRRALDNALQDRADDSTQHSTIIRIDLDHFKYVNDTMGHDAGDFILCEVARILREETKATDIAARVGGDEFVLLLSPGATSEEGRHLAQRMLDRIKIPKYFDSKSIRVGASFGVASTHEDLLDLDQLIIGADAALYAAKDAGRNRIRIYTETLHHMVLERRTLARELRRAVARQEFVPFFQPQFDAHTHEIVGVETLVRWDSPELGLLPPGQFLPVAEQLSLVEDIDNQIFAKAMKQTDSLRPLGIQIPKVSVNVTVERIHNDQVFEQIRAQRKDGPKIVFEILESVLVEEQSDLFRFGLDRLREAGVQIEIDDFGSGHASIVGLMHLQPDAMKIDQRLIRPILNDPIALGLLQHIVGMANLMDLRIVAEGVETLEHAQVLRDIGCHTLQGYAFCKPLPIKDLKVFILQHEARLRLQSRSS
ncbi:EAL domain-containing protein [Epibacterium sp. MM17-32]|uniref:putative bifunctional diguanylate cyclase/phosphodiesterase n=1 Tax=Epibacterium sp. MM17-32 TaxID=2917734 RepID=UPI001EF5B079|nr:EAL domain-containing protein [Epibacterium sp. MM17-32]MCG7627954.1 EAL domain-containing protein [Epibacterium sp. MM17-32]